MSVNSVAFYINAVKIFFDYHELTLAWKKIKRFIPERIDRKYHVYSKGEIKKLLAVANQRERAIILIMLSSGMRAEALVNLQVRDFEIMQENVGHFVVYSRTPSYYHTFCTPEATAALQLYLDWRKEMGEEPKPDSPWEKSQHSATLVIPRFVAIEHGLTIPSHVVVESVSEGQVIQGKGILIRRLDIAGILGSDARKGSTWVLPLPLSPKRAGAYYLLMTDELAYDFGRGSQ